MKEIIFKEVYVQDLNLLRYSEKQNIFYFQTDSRNVSGIYGIKRVATKQGPVWAFPNTYPDGYLALRDFKEKIKGGKANAPALKQIKKLKGVPDQIANLEILNSLNLEFERDPYPHQLETAETMLHFDNLAVLLEQGLGKTYCVHLYLQALAKLKGSNPKVLVLAPAIVLPNWVRETNQYTPFKAVQYTGTVEQRLNLRDEVLDSSTDLVITNFETLTTSGGNKKPTKEIILRYWENLPDLRKEALVDAWLTKGMDLDKELLLSEYTTKKKKGEIYKELKKVPEKFLITHDLLTFSRNQNDLVFLKSLPWDVLTIDEASRIKGHKTNRSLATMGLSEQIDKKYILSGTLCLGDPTDVYMPMTLLNKNIFGTNYKAFEKRYVMKAAHNKHIITGYKNLDELKYKMDPYIISKKRADCLFLPERIEDQRYYEMSQTQTNLYNEIVNNEEITIAAGTIDVSLTVVKINKLRQVLSGFLINPLPRNDELCNDCENLWECITEDIYPWDKELCKKWDPENPVKKPKRTYTELPNPKAELLVKDLEITAGKVIVWVYYLYDLEYVKKILREKEIPFITADEHECDHKFERDDTYKVFLGQISQGIGITLNSAKTTIYYSNGLGLEPRLQSMDRNHRIGQTESVLVKDYICPGSVEEKVVELLRHKEDVKDFIQSKNQCEKCKRSVKCFMEGVSPFSDGCVLKDRKDNAEEKRKLELCEV